VPTLEPYDMKRFVTSAYHCCGVVDTKLMLLGGWTSSSSMYQAYIEPNLLVTPAMREWFTWLTKEDCKSYSDLEVTPDTISDPGARPPKRLKRLADL
jgi:hypothetical protein